MIKTTPFEMVFIIRGIMDSIREYIITVTSAAVLCGILKSLLPGKDATASVLRLVSGIFLAFTVIRPIANISIGELPVISPAYLTEAEEASAEGEMIASDAMATIIKQQAEAYILDKARLLNAQVSVCVTLSRDLPPVPTEVRITGTVAPYARAQLEGILEKELGIAKENQIWIG